MKNNTLLITKLVTTNIGNQALSDEVIKLYEEFPKQLAIAGRPEGLFGYSIEKLKKTRNSVEAFEAWADHLVSKLEPIMVEAKFVPESKRVKLLAFTDFKVKNDNFFQVIKNIFRKYLHMESLFARAYKKRFLKIASVDNIVYSGAGEVGDNNIFLRQLLELRIAQKIGKKTYAINQSVEVKESPLREICGLVYKQMDQIIVRGEVSRKNLLSMGLSTERIQCFPDSAFLSATPKAADCESMKKKYDIQQPAVGINATKVANNMEAWGEIISLLKSLGYHLYFISNDPFGDKVIGEALATRYGLKPILEFIDYPMYAALLSNFKFVISCRLHTNELALTAQTPIIPIEGSHFKTSEVFKLVQYPIAVTNALTPGWWNDVKVHIQTLHRKDHEATEFFKSLDSIRSLSSHNRLV